MAAMGAKRVRVDRILPWLESDSDTDWAAKQAQIAASMAMSGVALVREAPDVP